MSSRPVLTRWQTSPSPPRSPPSRSMSRSTWTRTAQRSSSGAGTSTTTSVRRCPCCAPCASALTARLPARAPRRHGVQGGQEGKPARGRVHGDDACERDQADGGAAAPHSAPPPGRCAAACLNVGSIVLNHRLSVRRGAWRACRTRDQALPQHQEDRDLCQDPRPVRPPSLAVLVPSRLLMVAARSAPQPPPPAPRGRPRGPQAHAGPRASRDPRARGR